MKHRHVLPGATRHARHRQTAHLHKHVRPVATQQSHARSIELLMASKYRLSRPGGISHQAWWLVTPSPADRCSNLLYRQPAT